VDRDKGLVLDWLNNNLIDSESLQFYPVTSKVGKVENNQAELLNQ
jgi:putative SOS response-associated peptidase YedK